MYHPLFLIFKSSEFCPHSAFLLAIVLRRNSSYFPRLQKEFGACNASTRLESKLIYNSGPYHDFCRLSRAAHQLGVDKVALIVPHTELIITSNS